MRRTLESIEHLNAVAMGESDADMILTDCSLVSVYTNEIIPHTQIAVAGGRIAYVGPDARHTAGEKTRMIDLRGRYVAPGFADPHTHIDQFVMPSELVARSLLCGTTSLFSDPIDVVAVAGHRGFCEFVRHTRDLPARIFHVVPGGIPVDTRFSHGAVMSPSEQSSAIRRGDALGLGEVFSWTKVTARDPATMSSIARMLESDCVINGHTAGASGAKLNAYVSSGILSCHEPINTGQVLERMRLGMWVMMREGSIRRDLKDMIPELLSSGARLDRLMFCSDGLDPADIEDFGHIDHCVREAVRLGIDPIDAITMASRNCFDYYNMARDLGGIAPGRLADMLVLDDLESFRPRDVFVGGERVVQDGRLTAEIVAKAAPGWITGTVRLGRLSPEDFAVPSESGSATANTIVLLTEIVTKLGSADLVVRDGNVAPSRDADVWKVAAFDRTFGTGRRAVGFLENFGAEIGAFASTWSFHENDLIVIGSDESDMAAAANALAPGGGMTAVRDGETLAHMPLQFGGIISTDPFGTVSSNFASVTDSIVDAGCRFKRPHLVPLFLPFLALPSVRILHSGIIDVKRRAVMPALR